MDLCQGGEKTAYIGDAIGRQPTIEDRLIQQKQRLTAQLKDVTEALEALQANPELLKVMSLISKVHY